jgi:hypothetical protein
VGVGSNETAAPGFRLRCGAERVPIDERTCEGGGTTLKQACMVCLAFHPPYAILLGQWKVKGRDSISVVPSSWR